MRTTKFDVNNLTLKKLVTELSKYKTVEDLLLFAIKHFNTIGAGAYRRVWKVKLINKMVVLKIATCEETTHSNGTEVRVYEKCRNLSMSVLSKIYAYDTTNIVRRSKHKPLSVEPRWVVSEYIPNRPTNESIRNYFNISLEDWDNHINDFCGYSILDFFDSRKKDQKNNIWYQEFKKLLRVTKVADLHSGNFRCNEENMPVLVDYGCVN